MSNLQPNCCIKIDFQKADQHAGGKWLIYDTKRRKDNQLQSLKLPCRISHVSDICVIDHFGYDFITQSLHEKYCHQLYITYNGMRKYAQSPFCTW